MNGRVHEGSAHQCNAWRSALSKSVQPVLSQHRFNGIDVPLAGDFRLRTQSHCRSGREAAALTRSRSAGGGWEPSINELSRANMLAQLLGLYLSCVVVIVGGWSTIPACVAQSRDQRDYQEPPIRTARSNGGDEVQHRAISDELEHTPPLTGDATPDKVGVTGLIGDGRISGGRLWLK